MSDLEQLAYAVGRTQRRPTPAPSYEGIRLGSRLISIVAWINFFFAAFLLIFPLVAPLISLAVNGATPQYFHFAASGFAVFFILLPSAIIFLCFWAILLMVSHLALAIRDMAINSFRMD